MKRRDSSTLDLFKDFKPQPVVARFDEQEIRATSIAARMAKAVSKALKDDGRSRDKIAEHMSEIVGERVPASMLDAYASEAKEAHKITAERLLALIVATEDERLLNALLVNTGLIVVPARFEALIRREMAIEARDRLDKEINAARAEWEAKR